MDGTWIDIWNSRRDLAGASFAVRGALAYLKVEWPEPFLWIRSGARLELRPPHGYFTTALDAGELPRLSSEAQKYKHKIRAFLSASAVPMPFDATHQMHEMYLPLYYYYYYEA